MAFGYLVNMVATIPTWITLQVNQDHVFTMVAAAGTEDPHAGGVWE